MSDTRHEAAIAKLYERLHDHELLTPLDSKWADAGEAVKEAFIAAYDAARGGEQTVWTCMSCGGISDAQSCSACGAECRPGRWVRAALGGEAEAKADRALEDAEANLHRERVESIEGRRALAVIEAELARCTAARAALSQHPEPRQAEERIECDSCCDGDFPLSEITFRPDGKALCRDCLPEPRQDQPVDRASGEQDDVPDAVRAGTCECDLGECTCPRPVEHPDTPTTRTAPNPLNSKKAEQVRERMAAGVTKPFGEHPETGEREEWVIRTHADGVDAGVRFASPEPLQDGGERKVAHWESGAERDAMAWCLSREAAARSEGKPPYNSIFSLPHQQMFEAGWLCHRNWSARHPHQDVEHIGLDQHARVIEAMGDEELRCRSAEAEVKRLQVLVLRLYEERNRNCEIATGLAERIHRERDDYGAYVRAVGELVGDDDAEVDTALAPSPDDRPQTGAGLAGAPLGPQGAAPAAETSNPAPDDRGGER